MIEVPNEDTVIVDGVVYKAKASGLYCDSCAFDNQVDACVRAPCASYSRFDDQSVIFLEQVPCVSSQS